MKEKSKTEFKDVDKDVMGKETSCKKYEQKLKRNLSVCIGTMRTTPHL